MTTVLVVDDSALMRRSIRRAFEAEGDFEVHVAHDGQDALERITALHPDVVTLDINMPVMDGLTCLSHIMTDHPVPVVMLSSLTTRGALATFEALELGAVDFVPKPDGTVSLRLAEVVPHLVAKVRAAAGSRRARTPVRPRVGMVREQAKRPRTSPSSRDIPGVVVIGISTGGPKMLEGIVAALPADFPYPVLVAQHMPPHFTRVFAERLDAMSAVSVMEVNKAHPLHAGTVYLGAGGTDLVVERRLGRLVAAPMTEDATLWHPSVDRLVESAMHVVPADRIIGVQMTGMGNDGAVRFAELHQRGGHTVAESERSSVVFGMPRELIELGGASVVLDGSDIAGHLIERVTLAQTARHRLASA
ncbi:chemotaxis-specific protein-glutamate methyltransferase CheB [Roseospira marina]|uniref:Protein-glutamate methylesterase/protein-glutamine glutaminase n=1 Tax=Roseospira marina TaxID=140057 RepID=A0A5M6I7K0_9PROT|nr:chemotaxis-specific protein-glutamate methyltransferase CheB [Roseospira marina]KAA5603815.1 chemotaxis-specific protein-glutamate methyltransferase CheB [Roseospira marina]MBB4316027.1 two-component system chemotaxis response regulator CheB [Roseospira marina]MBB5089193.1 two-component system chemotaxis response regulator CheB [Roseospira marina]